MTNNQLFKSGKECCGCGSCINICPKNAISMKPDDMGFLYPNIDQSLCVDCGLCVKSCAFQNIREKNSPIEVYASVRKDKEKLKKSASGGIFAVVAEHILSENGAVFGCSMETEDGKFYPRHIKAENKKDLLKIQRSKYVQSDTGKIFREVKKELLTGKKILFSGTPCQVAGLKAFLKKDYENLYTLDLICHGVPSIKLFQDYISYMEQKRKIRIKDFIFRDKSSQGGLIGRITYTKNGKTFKKPVDTKLSSYYSYFLSGSIYRKSCYNCKYTNSHRTGDITIGDYWGFRKIYPDIYEKMFSIKDGISAMIINTEKGRQLFETIKDDIVFFQSDYESVSKFNPQLLQPCKKTQLYDRISEKYRKYGYSGIENLYRPTMVKNKLKKTIKKIIGRQ